MIVVLIVVITAIAIIFIMEIAIIFVLVTVAILIVMTIESYHKYHICSSAADSEVQQQVSMMSYISALCCSRLEVVGLSGV